MRKVQRLPEPDSLKKNKDKWTQDLLDQLEKFKGDYGKIPVKYKKRYRQNDVKETLKNMYSGLCCFCESKIGDCSFERIEHLRPKSKFPHLSFEWSNLNLCCEMCNNAKGNKWDDENPILNPTEDDPTEYLSFSYNVLVPKNQNSRGKTTIEHANLNRKGLREARVKILNKVIQDIEYIRLEGDPLKRKILKERILELADEGEEYCSFIRHLVNWYLKND